MKAGNVCYIKYRKAYMHLKQHMQMSDHINIFGILSRLIIMITLKRKKCKNMYNTLTRATYTHSIINNNDY